MKLNNFNSNRIKTAQERLNIHRVMGTKSNLSIQEVARLLDVVNGNDELVPEQATGLFFGLHSLN